MPNPETQTPQLPEGERRKDASAAILVMIEHLGKQVSDLSGKFDVYKQELAESRAALVESILHEAIPEGDSRGHREYHESVIARNKARAAFWQKMREELVKYGLIGFMVWALAALWIAFLKGPSK